MSERDARCPEFTERDTFVTHLCGPGDDDATGPCDGPEAVAREIADAVESLTGLWSMAAQEAALRLSLHQLRALRALEAAPDLNLTALAERLDIGLPTASRLCDRLEAAGLLERALHPDNRREVRLALTAQGQHVLDDVATRRSHALAAALTAMEPAELIVLRRGMHAYLAARNAARSRAMGPEHP
ncbi:MarR family winged helix-turn-helix transcriptional regulator [Streptomyces massasporeus]|uniref:MarR family winged helix-turn-helix transcriptional regulator n=1 Tax=Streptomyces massasporeus TaxID=67324 RepID=UPI0036F8E2D5